jgi:cell division protein FtsI (penicillin-binding protein 3)
LKRVPFFNNPIKKVAFPMWRGRLVLSVLAVAFLTLLGRAVYLQGIHGDFLQEQGGKRYERTITLPASRGKVLDRQGVVLAASIPARAIWAIPEDANEAKIEQIQALAKLLDTTEKDIRALLENEDKSFVYLRRQVPLEVAKKISALGMPGVHQLPETLRFYPEGEVTAHIVGFNDLDDKGQEGIELAYDSRLSGQPGSRRVIKDRLGRVIEDVREVNVPVNGADLTLSIDTRIQYQTYKALEEAVALNKAKSGAAVVVDVKTGEILALANFPTFDPNDRQTMRGPGMRNSALADTFEPGSILKPFTVGLALELQRITLDTKFNTGNGRFNYQGATINDVTKNGVIDARGVIMRSSNIGMTLISEKLQAKEMWGRFTELGFGQPPQIDYPGTTAGRLRPWEKWRLIEKATMAYGYGISTSLLQVARAYTAFAREGDMVNLTMIKRDNSPASVRIYPPAIANEVRSMLEGAAGPEGAKLAQVSGYRVAGKSGTARKIVNGAYSTKFYRGSFVGFAPVSDPRIVVAVSINEPSAGHYYGGRVAAPVYASIVGSALRVLGVQPDAPFESTVVAQTGGAQR